MDASIASKQKDKQKDVLANIPPWPLGTFTYENPLASAADVSGFRAEGRVHATFPEERLRLASEDGTFLF